MTARKTTTASDRVRASEARKIKAGGMRMPGGVLSAEAATALRYLCGATCAEGEYPTATAAISASLIREAKRVRRVRGE